MKVLVTKPNDYVVIACGALTHCGCYGGIKLPY